MRNIRVLLYMLRYLTLSLRKNNFLLLFILTEFKFSYLLTYNLIILFATD